MMSNSPVAPETSQAIFEGAPEISGHLNTILLNGAPVRELGTLVPEWIRANSPDGYQHNRVSLGDHTRQVIEELKSSTLFGAMTPGEQHVALLAAFFHDIGKPTGRQTEKVRRDFDHELPSAEIAGDYMRRWGYSEMHISIVQKVVLFDGIASDVARGKVRDPSKDILPTELAARLGNDMPTIRILEAVNTADAIATVGFKRFERLLPQYNEYWYGVRLASE